MKYYLIFKREGRVCKELVNGSINPAYDLAGVGVKDLNVMFNMDVKSPIMVLMNQLSLQIKNQDV